MARAANEIKTRLREYAFDQYLAAWCLEPRGGRIKGVPAYSLYFPISILGIISPNEVTDLIGCTAGEAMTILTGGQWTAGVSDTVYGLPALGNPPVSTMAFWEVKAGRDTPSKEQVLFLEIMRRLGYVVGLISDQVEVDVDYSIVLWEERQRVNKQQSQLTMKQSVPLQSATLGRLNPTAQKIFRIIDNYIRENGISPTVREIAWQAGDLSTSVVGYNLDRLKEAGFITKQAGMARSIQVVGR